MSIKYMFISDSNWFESTALSNPLICLDSKLEAIYPEFYEVNYDLKLLAAKSPTKLERVSPFYNDYLDRFGNSDITTLKIAAQEKKAKNILLCGFSQEHLKYLIPYIKDSVEILYLHKCPNIRTLSVLSECKNLKCVLMYANNSLKTLWNMKDNKNLIALSLDNVPNLASVNSLVKSNVEYLSLDTMTPNGNVKECLINDIDVFKKIPKLKHLKLVFKNLKIDY